MRAKIGLDPFPINDNFKALRISPAPLESPISRERPQGNGTKRALHLVDFLSEAIVGAGGGCGSGMIVTKVMQRGLRFCQVERYFPHTGLIVGSGWVGMTALGVAKISDSPLRQKHLRSVFFAQLGAVPGAVMGGAVGFGAGSFAIVTAGSRDSEQARLYVGAGMVGGCLVGGLVSLCFVTKAFLRTQRTTKFNAA